jgi:hypothetical protein
MARLELIGNKGYERLTEVFGPLWLIPHPRRQPQSRGRAPRLRVPRLCPGATLGSAGDRGLRRRLPVQLPVDA